MKTIGLLLALVLGTLPICQAQNTNIDYNQFIRETQKNSSEGGKINIVWWIPLEFWEITLKKNKSLSDEQVVNFIEELRPYSIFAVIQGDMGAMGNLSYVPLDSIKNNISVQDNDHKNYYPLAPEKLDYALQTLLSNLKPVLKNAMGQLGENMIFLCLAIKKKMANAFRILTQKAMCNLTCATKNTNGAHPWAP